MKLRSRLLLSHGVVILMAIVAFAAALYAITNLTRRVDAIAADKMEALDSTERIRGQMGEPYRTLVGHFRHELGHHFWRTLVNDKPALDGFRAIFRDERADYLQSAATYYREGPPQVICADGAAVHRRLTHHCRQRVGGSCSTVLAGAGIV